MPNTPKKSSTEPTGFPRILGAWMTTTLRLIPVSEFNFRPSTNRDSATNFSAFRYIYYSMTIRKLSIIYPLFSMNALSINSHLWKVKQVTAERLYTLPKHFTSVCGNLLSACPRLESNQRLLIKSQVLIPSATKAINDSN